jgi:bifunctional non-homologous end joining protein LigD
MPASKSVEVRVGQRTLTLTNLDKPLYPSGFTKAQVVDYYSRIAPALLPHLTGRALTLKRYPNGADQQFFYEKHAPKHRPDWIKTVEVHDILFVTIDDLAALTWIANLAALELHAPLALAKAPDLATALAFDLDPGAPANILTCAKVALELREILTGLKLSAYPKTSGNKGMQVYVPIKPASFDDTKAFAHAIARLMEERAPDRITSVMKKDLRGGKIFIDWSQNDVHKTTVDVYSLRARERPTVSTPLTWAEVERGAKSREVEDLTFEAKDVIARFEKHGDLFADVLRGGPKLPMGLK